MGLNFPLVTTMNDDLFYADFYILKNTEQV